VVMARFPVSRSPMIVHGVGDEEESDEDESRQMASGASQMLRNTLRIEQVKSPLSP
jgi:hypothetical protein